ncbi:MAG: transcription/translation regulatory transformer protein RfaH [Gammaproteobacteria bacterium]|nr:transcription/translation regulatory transformer protein RfaH [Gammaproteobacteria bacterium]
MEKWYAILTKPRQESIAEENLRRQSYNTYLPRIKELRKRRGKWRHVIGPLFPRYLFISLNLGIDNIYSIHSTRGVSNLVRFGAKPTPVPKYFVETLRRSADQETGIHVLHRPPIKKGDSVTIIHGPLAGLQGIFQATKGEERVILLLDILGKANSVTLQRSLIQCT